MQKKASFNQTAITSQLTGTNNAGVCFSLCLKWLTNDRSKVDAINSVNSTDYASTSTGPLYEVQNVANNVPVDISAVVAVAKARFPIGAVERGVSRTLPGDLTADLGSGQYPVNLVWLMESGGRGHVVGYDKVAGLYFDPNQGIFGPDDVTQLDKMREQVAADIATTYKNPPYTGYAVFSVEPKAP